MIIFYRFTCIESCAGKAVCDRNIAIKNVLRKWIKESKECSTAQHVVQGLAEMRLNNSFESACVGHDANFKPLVVMNTKDAKLIGRISDIGFDHSTFGEPLGLRVREKCGIVPHKVILEKQLVLPSNSY